MKAHYQLGQPNPYYSIPSSQSYLDDERDDHAELYKGPIDEPVTLKTPHAILAVFLYLMTMAFLVIAFELIKPTVFFPDDQKPT